MPKVLISGEVLGASSLSALEVRVNKLQSSAHGPFDAVLVAGLDAAAVCELRARASPFPIPLHFIAARERAAGDADALAAASLADFAPGAAVCAASGATYHGPASAATLAGLRVAFFESPHPRAVGPASEFVGALGDARSPLGGGGVFDCLVTTDWPVGALRGVDDASVGARVAALRFCGTDAVAGAAHAAQPRYHFASGQPAAFARAPYANRGAGARRVSPVTRLIALAPVGDGTGAGADGKFLHALALSPAADLASAVLAELPAGTTPSPYIPDAPPLLPPPPPAALKRAREDDAAGGGAGAARGGLSAARVAELTAEAERAGAGGPVQHFFALKQQQLRVPTVQRGPRGGGNHSSTSGVGAATGAGATTTGTAAAHPPECWFCLASPHVEKHLVVAIGNEAYVVLPKGGVAASHVLVVPVAHCSSLARAPDGTRAEVSRFLSALEASNAARDLATVAFERVLRGSGTLPQHTMLQVCGVPLADAARAADAFVDEGRFKGISFEELAADADADAAAAALDEYLIVNAPPRVAGGARVRLLHAVPTGARHPLQFGREVLCRILKAPERITWKSCVVSVEDETRQAGAARDAFAAFDFTLEL